MFAAVYNVILMFAVFGATNASHFRGAIFSWTPLEDGATIKIKFRISWRRTSSSNWCNDTDISTGSLIGSGDMTCYSGCSGTVGSLQYHCTDYSEEDDWSSGRNEVIYKAPAKSFSFRFSSCCWIETLNVGAGGDWSVLATVDLSVRSDTGRINSSPTVEMTPVLNLQDGCPYTIFLQVGDVDGDIVKCRWAKGDIECEDVCGGLIDAVLDEEACSITYNPNGTQDLHAAALQIEDFASTESATPFSSIPLQFIVKVNSGNSCDDIPEFIQPTPDDSSCFALEVGDNLNVTVKARGSKIIKTITTISPIGMVESSQKKWQDSTWHYIEMNVTWTPTEDDAGQDHALCFYATISTGVTSQIRCINLPVSVSGPTPLRVERVGFTNTWTIIIDQTFARPTEAAYIKVYESSTNTELISVDASSSSDVVFDPVNRQINVSFNYDFDIEEDYYVTIPSGLVEGFVSCGALSVAVNDSGFWKIEVDCGKPTVLNGDVNAPNGTDYPHSVFYVCKSGYYLVGVSKRMCTAIGTWTDNAPSCNAKDCGNFSIPDNGYVSTNSTIYNTTVEFYCDEGYEISGKSSMFCEDTGVWTTSPPVCTLVVCGFLQAPANGLIKASAATHGTIATFTCNEGYDLVGDDTLVCTADGVWNGSAPSCKIKDCGSLSSPSNGSILMNDTTFSSHVFYLCDSGFELKGVDIRICLGNGTWSESAPSCIVLDCGIPLPPENGDVLFNETVYGSKCFFSCYPGYDFKGINVSVCTGEGVWNNSQTECIIKDCGPLTSPNNGTVSYSTTTYLSTAVYRCNTGYTLVGMNVTECTAVGIWSSTIPTCQIVDCGPLHVPKHGRISSTVTTFDQTVNFTCDIGYDLLGNSQRTCLVTGLWSGAETICKIKDCGTLEAPDGGTVEITNTSYLSRVSYKCNIGYDLEGVSIRYCSENGSWSHSAPSCLIKDCGNLTSPDNGTVSYSTTTYLSTAVYSCNIGYTLVGTNVTECTSAGIWSSTIPNCQIVDCGSLPVPRQGSISSTVTTFEQTVNFTCDNGYDLVGNNQTTCLVTGLWSGTETICKIKDCGIPSPPHNGNISFVNTTYGSVARYFCFTGYRIKGGELVSCGADGFWSITGQDCIKKGTSAVLIYVLVGGAFCLVLVIVVIAVIVLLNRKNGTLQRDSPEPINLSSITQLTF